MTDEVTLERVISLRDLASRLGEVLEALVVKPEDGVEPARELLEEMHKILPRQSFSELDSAEVSDNTTRITSEKITLTTEPPAQPSNKPLSPRDPKLEKEIRKQYDLPEPKASSAPGNEELVEISEAEFKALPNKSLVSVTDKETGKEVVGTRTRKGRWAIDSASRPMNDAEAWELLADTSEDGEVYVISVGQ